MLMFISLYTGMNKMVINHLEKLFVTNDAATILRELEVRISNHNCDACINLYHLEDYLYLFFSSLPQGSAPSSQNDSDGVPHAGTGSRRWHKLCSGVCWSSAGACRGAAEDGSVSFRGQSTTDLMHCL